MQGQVHDLGAAVENLERERQNPNRIVNELDVQIGGLNYARNAWGLGFMPVFNSAF